MPKQRQFMPDSDSRLSMNDENINDTSRVTPRISINPSNNQQSVKQKQNKIVVPPDITLGQVSQIMEVKDSYSNYNSVQSMKPGIGGLLDGRQTVPKTEQNAAINAKDYNSRQIQDAYNSTNMLENNNFRKKY